MEEIIKLFQNEWVAVYLFFIIGTLAYYVWDLNRVRRNREKKRKQAGLPDSNMVRHAVTLKEFRQEAKDHALITIAVPFLFTFLFYLMASLYDLQGAARLGWALLLVTVWVLFVGTDVAKSALGGIAFKVATAFNNTMQVGDRVTIMGVSGRITEIDTFYVKLQTLDGDAVAIPTSKLWGEKIISANAGERSSLCVIPFYFSAQIQPDSLQLAEDIIWDSIQASSFYEPSHSMQIDYRQESEYICLTARAYVASTYHEPLFKSDVYKNAMMQCMRKSIPLAGQLRPINIRLSANGEEILPSNKEKCH